MEQNDHFGTATCRIGMLFPPGSVEQAIRLLLSDVGRTEALPGCRSCVVSRDATEDARVLYREEWASRQALLNHLRSDAFRHVLVAMDLCAEEPSVEIGSMTGRCGLQYLEELRGRDGTAAEAVPREPLQQKQGDQPE